MRQSLQSLQDVRQLYRWFQQMRICIGAPLARLEASIALPMMLEQLPRLQRVPDIPLELLDTRALFGVKRLPITFTPTSSNQSTRG